MSYFLKSVLLKSTNPEELIDFLSALLEVDFLFEDDRFILQSLPFELQILHDEHANSHYDEISIQVDSQIELESLWNRYLFWHYRTNSNTESLSLKESGSLQALAHLSLLDPDGRKWNFFYT